MWVYLKLTQEDQNFLKKIQKKYNIGISSVCKKLLKNFIIDILLWKARGEKINNLKRKIHSSSVIWTWDEYEKFYINGISLFTLLTPEIACKCVKIQVSLPLYQQKFIKNFISKLVVSKKKTISAFFTGLIKQEIWKNNLIKNERVY